MRQGLPEYDWTELSLPPRHFKWRLRGNAWWWALEEPVIHRDYALVVATSMVDLASLVGLVPTLGRALKVAYFHENQFAYPTRGAPFDMNLGLANIYTALAADVVVFNSDYNRQTLLDGVDWMRAQLPDYVPPSTRDRIAARSDVIVVPLEDACFDVPHREQKERELQIVWNHRWEYDKAPERLFAALEQMTAPFHVHVVGERFRDVPEAMLRGRDVLGDRVRTWGFVESSAKYRALLGRCDVVVSTALHEFQGLAVLDAIAAGCVAAAPDRLVYPELLPPHFLYRGHDDPVCEARNLARHLDALASRVAELRASPKFALTHFRTGAVWKRWRALIAANTSR